MKLNKLLIVLLLGSSISLAQVGGRAALRQRRNPQSALRTRNSSKRIVEFDLTYEVSVVSSTRSVNLLLLIPKTLPNRQRILSTKYSSQPIRVFNENGNRYAEFSFNNPEKQIDIVVSIKAELFRYDLQAAMEMRIKNTFKGPQFRDFQKQEKYIEKDNQQIREVADDIEGETQVETVENIYNYVLDNMEYAVLGKRDVGAAKALQRGKGDCTEYSDLFVALCRAKGIPARVASGYTAMYDPAQSKHNWAEVYLQDYGWVPFDPSAGDIRNEFYRGRAFKRLRPVYIYFSSIRNDDVLNNYQFARFSYRGGRIRFSDSIEFKLPD